MTLLAFILNPAIMAVGALFLSVVWMVRDESDKTRPLLVFALTLNVFFGFLLTYFMGREGGLLPFKYDHVLLNLDGALGLSAAGVARPLQGSLRIPFIVVYQLMVPMMILWFLVTQYRNMRGSVVLAYAAELVAGPLLYAMLPGCGPAYAFRGHWLSPPAVAAEAVRLVGMPNAFPSLHMGTALVLVLFAPGKLWRAIAVAFLAATGLATLSTGEHYIIDLVAGLAFGCFAASVGYRRARPALAYLAVTVAWTLAVRFGFGFLIAHAAVLGIMVAGTVAIAIHAVVKEWLQPALSAPEPERA